jgi:DNA repair exonuclease SbcCD ATPase subunit
LPCFSINITILILIGAFFNGLLEENSNIFEHFFDLHTNLTKFTIIFMQELVTRVENMTEKVRKLIEQNERLRRHNAFLVVENENLSEEVAAIRQGATQLEQELQDKFAAKIKTEEVRYDLLNADFMKLNETVSAQQKEWEEKITNIKAELNAQQMAYNSLEQLGNESAVKQAELVEEQNKLQTINADLLAHLAAEKEAKLMAEAKVKELEIQVSDLQTDTQSQYAALQDALKEAQIQAAKNEQDWQDKMTTILEQEQRRIDDLQNYRHQLELHLRAMEQCIDELYKQPKKG